MCVIEHKTYRHADGERRVLETTLRCRNATATRLCSDVRHRSIEATRVVDNTPMSTSSTSDGMLVTETKDGRRRVYRDLSRRSSQRNSIRRSNNTSNRSSADSLAPPVSPSVVEVRPRDLDEPIMSSALPRRPSYPPTLPPEPTVRLTPDGTAVYERRPATPDRQRPSATQRVSEPGLANRRPSLSIRTSNQRSNTSSPMSSSPGLSNLPKLSDIRRDSARDLPLRDSSGNRTSDNEFRSREAARESARLSRANSEAKHRREEAEIARAAEDRRLAQLEQDRFAARERARAESAAEAASRERRRREDASRERRQREGRSRERHLRTTRDALEGELAAKARARDLDLDERLEAELRALDLEKERAAIRRSQQEQAARNAERSYSPQGPRLPLPIVGGGSRYSSASPVSPRGTTRRVISYGAPAIHQDSSSSRPGDVIRDRGRAVIEREQAKDLPPRLSSTNGAQQATLGLQGAILDERYYDEALYQERRQADGYFAERDTFVANYVSDGPARREARRVRRERDERREERKAEFWR